MNYREAREYIQTIGKLGMVFGLDSMRRLLYAVGNPEKQLRFVHVAGTNGKGSVIAYVLRMLVSAGYKTGVYTSPAVFDELEIYRINGVNISEEAYGRLMETMKNAVGQIMAAGHPSPTRYELETALALLYFAEESCELVLLETGLGGKLDATNCIPAPICAVLTSISRDHMGVLGDSLEEIAAQKAGIIKEGCHVVSSPQEMSVMDVIRDTCVQKKVPLAVAEKEKLQITKSDAFPPRRTLRYKDFPEVTISLYGEHQIENAATALEVAAVLQAAGYELEREHLVTGLSGAKWQGRLTVLQNHPLILVDGAHNENAALRLAKTLHEDFFGVQWGYIMGVLADKEYEKVVEHMAPSAKKVWTITPDNPRALDANKLAEVFCDCGCMDVEATEIPHAMEQALSWCRENENRGILIFGSFTFLKDIRIYTDNMLVRTNRMLSHPLFLEKMEQLEQLEQNRQFCRHGWEHCMDVARGMALLNEERKLGFSKDLLYSLALVHDLGRVEEYRQGIPHEQAGAVLAEQILSDCGYEAEELQKASKAVSGHRTTHTEEELLTALLKEADKRTRLCFRCKAREQCKWPGEKMNLFIEL